MKRSVSIFILLLIPLTFSWGQAKTRRLPSIINHPSLNLYAPYISFDGNALLFVSNDGEDGALTVAYTSRETDWVEPKALPKHVNHRLVYLRGFALSADGKKLFLTSTKSPIVGGYDIISSDLKGSTWSEPVNLNAPINSKTNEGSPSLSADGNTLYFMRCDKMDQNTASGCKLFVSSKKGTGPWEDPKELPAHINTGNSQTPRIMADGETLIFSSDKMSSTKGGMDLYETRLRDGSWTNPVPLEFVNTDKDDQFISVAALGRYLVRDEVGARKSNELVEYLIPNDLRPRGMMKVEGYVKDAVNNAVSSYISVTDLATNKRVFSGRPNADGTYMLYLMEGTRYEMAIDPEQSNVSFFAKPFDLTGDKIAQRERVNVVLKQPVAGDELLLDLVSFKANSDVLESVSEPDLKRLVRLAKANPQLRFELQISMTGYKQDSVMSDIDLSEVRLDTLQTQVASIDSVGQLVKRDTLTIRQLYHNDRTVKQAQAMLNYLVKQGGDQNSFAYITTVAPAATPEERKLIVKAVAREK